MLRQSLIVLQVLVAAMADDAVLDDLQARRPRSLVEAAPESGVHGQQQALVEDLQSGDSCRQVLTRKTQTRYSRGSTAWGCSWRRAGEPSGRVRLAVVPPRSAD